MRRRLAVLAFVLIACGQPRPSAVISSSPSPSPSTRETAPATVAPTPSTTPNAVEDMPVTAVDFSCRLPIVTSTFVWPGPDVPPGGAGVTLQGGFITFPAAQFAEDAAGKMHDGHPGPTYATTATPVLYGNGEVPFYDRPESRWVPAPARQALPDGSAYAYITNGSSTDGGTAHVVNVASGNSRSFNVPPINNGYSPLVADYGAAGVYIVDASGIGGPLEGVLLLDPVTGSTKLLRQVHGVWEVRDGYAWIARFDTRDKTVWPPAEGTPANSLIRVDLATGAETVWFYRAGTYPSLVGLDSLGRPVVHASGNGLNDLLLLDRPGSPGQLVTSSNPGLDFLQGDGDRLWFGGPYGIYLYRPDRGFQKVFAYNGSPGSGNYAEPAGFCR